MTRRSTQEHETNRDRGSGKTLQQLLAGGHGRALHGDIVDLRMRTRTSARAGSRGRSGTHDERKQRPATWMMKSPRCTSPDAAALDPLLTLTTMSGSSTPSANPPSMLKPTPTSAGGATAPGEAAAALCCAAVREARFCNAAPHCVPTLSCLTRPVMDWSLSARQMPLQVCCFMNCRTPWSPAFPLPKPLPSTVWICTRRRVSW